MILLKTPFHLVGQLSPSVLTDMTCFLAIIYNYVYSVVFAISFSMKPVFLALLLTFKILDLGIFVLSSDSFVFKPI